MLSILMYYLILHGYGLWLQRSSRARLLTALLLELPVFWGLLH